MTNVVELQRKRIAELENRVSELTQEVCRLSDTNHNLSTILVYLTEDEFRKFAFKLNYNNLITDYLENESHGDEWI